MFLSHTDVFFLPLSLSLPLSLKSINIFLGEHLPILSNNIKPIMLTEKKMFYEMFSKTNINKW